MGDRITYADPNEIWAKAVPVRECEHVSREIGEGTLRVVEKLNGRIADVLQGGSDVELVNANDSCLAQHLEYGCRSRDRSSDESSDGEEVSGEHVDAWLEMVEGGWAWAASGRRASPYIFRKNVFQVFKALL